MIEILAEGFDRIQVVLAQGKGARRCRRPSVYKSHLDYVVRFLAAPNPGASFSDANVNLRQLIQVMSVVGVLPANDGIGNEGIDFDSSDVRTPTDHCCQYIDTPAWTDDGVFTARTKQARNS